MSYDSIRQTLVTHVKVPFETAFPDVKVFYDNAPFDLDNPAEHYVEFEVKFYGGQQIGASATPRTRVSGFVYVTAISRKGLGPAKCLQILDWFASHLEYQTPGGVQLQAAEPDGGGSNKDWYTESIKVAFYKDP